MGSAQPGPDAESYEQTIRRMQQEAVDQALKRLLDLIELFVPGLQVARRVLALANSDLVSGVLVERLARAKLDRGSRTDITDRVLNFRRNLREMILNTANAVEYYEYYNVEQAVRQIGSAYHRDRGLDLLSAEKAFRVSIQDVTFTIEVFRKANQRLIDRVDHPEAARPETQRDLALANAVLVYELSDFVTGYLENFSVDGITRLTTLRREIKTSIQQKKAKVAADRQRAETGQWPAEMRSGFLTECDDNLRALERCDGVWDEYLASQTEAAGLLGAEVDRLLPIMRMRRDLAFTRIGVLEVTDLTAQLHRGATELRSLDLTVAQLPLVSLSIERLNLMIGLV